MIKTRREMQGKKLPFFYGLTYYDVCWAQIHIHLIPLNLIIRYIRLLFIKIKYSKPSKFEDKLLEAYSKGRRDGRRSYKEEFRKDLRKHVSRMQKGVKTHESMD